jgi:hypothetical protein
MFAEDMIFNNIAFYGMEITEEQVENFRNQIFSEDLSDEYVVDSLEFVFKVNKSKNEFRILKRYYYETDVYVGRPTPQQIDYVVFTAYKLAHRAGLNVFLENKYSN